MDEYGIPNDPLADMIEESYTKRPERKRIEEKCSKSEHPKRKRRKKNREDEYGYKVEKTEPFDDAFGRMVKSITEQDGIELDVDSLDSLGGGDIDLDLDVDVEASWDEVGQAAHELYEMIKPNMTDYEMEEVEENVRRVIEASAYSGATTVRNGTASYLDTKNATNKLTSKKNAVVKRGKGCCPKRKPGCCKHKYGKARDGKPQSYSEKEIRRMMDYLQGKGYAVVKTNGSTSQGASLFS